MIHVGKTTRKLRTTLGLTIEQFCEALAGPYSPPAITLAELEAVEANAIYPPEMLLRRVRDVYGVDLYVLAWLWFGDANQLKEPLRSKVIELTKSWGERAEAAIASAKDGGGA